MSILDGIRVIEIPGTLGAAWAGRNLADWGANVTVVEPASGSPLRNEPPQFEAQGIRHSAAWEWLTLGKRLHTLGEGQTARDHLAEQCRRADIVLIDTEMAGPVFGVSPLQLQELLAGAAVVLAISPFGLAGPGAEWRATDLGVQARGGWMGSVGAPDREPLRVGGEMTPRLCGGWAMAAALAGLRHAEQGGEPPFIDLSAQAVIASVTLAVVLMQHMGGMPGWTLGRRGNLWPIAVSQCADGFIGCGPLTAAHWEMMCHMLGIPDVLEEPGGLEAAYWLTNGPAIYERVRPWYEARTRKEIMELAQAYRLPAASIQSLDERLECPQNTARGVWQQIEIAGRIVKAARPPIRIRGAETAPRTPATQTDNIDLGERPPRTLSGAVTARPYEGLRVLDLTCFWAGPYGAMMLGALGADVIKVESVQRPDPFRYTGVSSRDEKWYERGPLWNDTNCDKRGLTVDLTDPEGLSLFKRLVGHADIVMSNFSNRVMPNLGLDADSLLAINPRIIVVTSPAYGPGGPWEHYVGFGRSFEQIAGVVSMTGYSNDSPENPGGFSDPFVGALLVAGIDLALRERQRTGKGTHVELAQCEALDSVFSPEHIAIQFGAPVPERVANKHECMAPHNSYRAAGEDSWLTIAVATDAEFAALAQHLDLPLDRFATAEARKQTEEALDQLIQTAVLTRDASQLEQDLQAAGVKACRVVTPQEIEFDPDLSARTFFEPVERALTGVQPYRSLPFRFSSIPTEHRFGPSLLGEHSEQLLRELLAMPESEIARLQATNIIGTRPLAMTAG